MIRNDPVPAVLAVDDDEEYLKYLGMVLAAAGASPCLAASAHCALEVLKRERFALVIADLRLGPDNGLEVLRAAREIDPLSVGMVMTAYGSVESALEALGQGVYDYLLKPCPVEVLRAAVRRGLEYHVLKRSLMEQTAEIDRLQRELSTK